jgi:hypothetical protein
MPASADHGLEGGEVLHAESCVASRREKTGRSTYRPPLPNRVPETAIGHGGPEAKVEAAVLGADPAVRAAFPA